MVERARGKSTAIKQIIVLHPGEQLMVVGATFPAETSETTEQEKIRLQAEKRLREFARDHFIEISNLGPENPDGDALLTLGAEEEVEALIRDLDAADIQADGVVEITAGYLSKQPGKPDGLIVDDFARAYSGFVERTRESFLNANASKTERAASSIRPPQPGNPTG